MSATVRIGALHHYPLKSARGIALDRAVLTSTGLPDDRRWMITTDTGRFVTQRELPRLAVLRPWLSPDELVLRAPAMPELRIALAHSGEPRSVSVWQDNCRALDEGDAAAHWLRQFLERDCRLVRFDPSQQRLSSPVWAAEHLAENLFSDGFPLLAIGRASLEDLNRRLSAPLPMNRFRPNLVLEGLEPYDEDRIDELVCGQIRLKFVKPCTRCRITTTNQESGELEGEEPLRTLKSYRYDAALRGVCFGQNLIILGGIGATLLRGQRFEVRWKSAPIAADGTRE